MSVETSSLRLLDAPIPTVYPVEPPLVQRKGLRNPFLLFSETKRAQVKAAHPDWAVTDINKELGAMWKRLSDLEQKPFKEQYKVEKAVLLQTNPEATVRTRKEHKKKHRESIVVQQAHAGDRGMGVVPVPAMKMGGVGRTEVVHIPVQAEYKDLLEALEAALAVSGGQITREQIRQIVMGCMSHMPTATMSAVTMPATAIPAVAMPAVTMPGSVMGAFPAGPYPSAFDPTWMTT